MLHVGTEQSSLIAHTLPDSMPCATWIERCPYATLPPLTCYARCRLSHGSQPPCCMPTASCIRPHPVSLTHSGSGSSRGLTTCCGTLTPSNGRLYSALLGPGKPSTANRLVSERPRMLPTLSTNP